VESGERIALKRREESIKEESGERIAVRVAIVPPTEP